MPPKFAESTGDRLAARSSRGASGSGQLTEEPQRGADDFDEESGLTLKQHPAEYRRAAARARRLEGEATTSRVRQYLRAVIDQCERLAGEAEEVNRSLSSDLSKDGPSGSWN